MQIVQTTKEMSSNLRADGILLVSFALLMLGILFPTISEIGKVLVVIFVVYRRNASDIPALICLLSSSNTFGLGADNVGFYTKLSVLGMPIQASYVFVLMATVALVMHYCTKRKPKQQRMLFFFWLVTLPISTIISFVGRYAGDTMWAVMAITHLLFILYFWGRLLADTWRIYQLYVLRRLVLVMGLFYLIGCIHMFGTHLVFFSAGVLPGLATYLLIRDRSIFWKIISVSGIACIMYFLFIKGGSASSSDFFVYTEDVSSFTTSFFFIGSSLCGVMAAAFSRNDSVPRRYFVATQILIVVSIIIMIVAMARTAEFDRRGQLSYWERVENKMFGDRGRLWLAFKRDVFQAPYIIKHPYKPVDGLDGELFFCGAHNVILESWRRNGFLAGSVLILVYYLAIIRAVRAISLRAAGEHGVALLGGLWTVGIGGGLVNMFGLSLIVGGLLMLLAGVVSATADVPTILPKRGLR
jgi:hypothetical protein